jgi:hypothetical protein
VFHDWGISDFDGQLPFYAPRKAGSTHYSQDPGRGCPQPVLGHVRRLTTIVQSLGHDHIDVLKLDVEGSEFEAVPDLLASGVRVEQLLVEIHYHFHSRSFREGLALIDLIKRNGMQCVHVSPRGLEFAFVRTTA